MRIVQYKNYMIFNALQYLLNAASEEYKRGHHFTKIECRLYPDPKNNVFVWNQNYSLLAQMGFSPSINFQKAIFASVMMRQVLFKS